MSAVHSNIKGKVFGILLDGEDFYFGLLDDKNKFYVSKALTPITKQAQVLAYIDMMLWNVMKNCNVLPDGDQNSPPQNMSNALSNEYTTFRFEDTVDDVEADKLEGTNYKMTDLVSLRFPNGQVVFKSGNSLQ